MPFEVKHDKYLATELERVTSIILMPKFWNRAWTIQSLKTALNDIGLDYSLPQIKELNEELHKAGIVEDKE